MKTSKKGIAAIGVVCLLSVMLLSSCLKDNVNYAQPPIPTALVSFVVAATDQPPLDLYFNNNRVNSAPLGYGSELDYFRAYTGQRTVNIYNDASSTKLFSDTINLKKDSVYSLFLVSNLQHLQTLLIPDSISAPSAGNAAVRFVDVSPDAPAADLLQNGSVVASNKTFKGYSSFVQLKGNTSYNFVVQQHGSSTTLASLSNVQLNAGFVYTIWLHGLANTSNAVDKLSVDIIPNAFF
ncbi:MAG: DUF4397 domain-containing protein [Bacteroidetes bacterium]|nr:DUF4397 domain-containing protein [Bacteroidota bacterium]